MPTRTTTTHLKSADARRPPKSTVATDGAARREAQRRLRAKRQARTYPPLANETRDVVDTNAAAFYLWREPQTLRVWACKENGPIVPSTKEPLKPININGRLGWSVAFLREIVGV
jgi:hypothetical protein